jgi:hypothetical protein
VINQKNNNEQCTYNEKFVVHEKVIVMKTQKQGASCIGTTTTIKVIFDGGNGHQLGEQGNQNSHEAPIYCSKFFKFNNRCNLA